MWLNNVWYVAGFEHELDAPVLARTIIGKQVVMMRSTAGVVTALEDACPHRLLPLSKGRRTGDEIRCGYHGMKFDLNGVCIEIPGQTSIPAKACVKTYPIVVKHGLVWLWLGNPEVANDNLIPDLHWHSSPEWTSSRGYHLIECDFRLMNDNLLDLSHETYVHIKTIGNEEEETIANFPMEVSVIDDTLVRAHREMPDIDPPPFFAFVLKTQGLINRWQTAIHHLPSINMTDVGVYPVGSPRENAHVMHVLHLVTPETEHSSHYFWAVVRNFDLEDDALTETIRTAIGATFDEDKEIVELQHAQVVKRCESVPRVAIKLDEASVKARRLLAQQVEIESTDRSATVKPVPLLAGQ